MSQVTVAFADPEGTGNGAPIDLTTAHPADAAQALAELEPAMAWAALGRMLVTRQAAVFGYLEPHHQVALARSTSRHRLATIVTEMDADERADLFNRLEPEQQEALMPALAQAEREDIRRLASYAEDTAGALMTSDYAILAPDLTVRDALDRLRHEAPEKETIYRAYVTDPDRRLIGSVRLRDLILAPPGVRVADLMDRETLAVHVDDDQEAVAGRIARYDVIALPVTDDEGRIVGIVTHDDAIDVVQEEATEDFHKVGTVGRIEGTVRDAGLGLLYRKRVFWLVLLVFANLFTGAGIALFEDTIATYVALVFFLPLLIGSAGNAGSQAATLMVRALATNDVVLRDWGRMLGRELLVAGALGLTMAAAVSAIGMFRGGPAIALVVASTMLIVVVIGSVIGMSLPFLLSRLKLDPATASTPLVTTIADAVGVVVYFALATTLLGIAAA